jgi:hypothetical protein
MHEDELSRPEFSRRPGADLALAISFIVVQAVLGVLIFGASLVLSFSAAGCSSHPCNFDLAAFALYLGPVVAVVSILACIALTVVRFRRGKSLWIAPVCGAVTVAVAGVVGWILERQALS